MSPFYTFVPETPRSYISVSHKLLQPCCEIIKQIFKQRIVLEIHEFSVMTQGIVFEIIEYVADKKQELNDRQKISKQSLF
jgi:hypothetical protein